MLSNVLLKYPFLYLLNKNSSAKEVKSKFYYSSSTWLSWDKVHPAGDMINVITVHFVAFPGKGKWLDQHLCQLSARQFMLSESRRRTFFCVAELWRLLWELSSSVPSSAWTAYRVEVRSSQYNDRTKYIEAICGRAYSSSSFLPYQSWVGYKMLKVQLLMPPDICILMPHGLLLPLWMIIIHPLGVPG